MKFRIKASSRSAWLVLLLLPLGVLFSLSIGFLMLFDPRSWRFDRAEAAKLLREKLECLAEKSREELAEVFGDTSACSELVVGGSGTEYQIQVTACRNGESLLLLGSIADGGLRAFLPLTDEIELSGPNALNR